MNFLTVKLSHTYFTQQSIKNLLIDIDNYNIKIYTENKLLFINVEGENNNQDLFESFLCVYQLLFLYLGCFPKIIELNQNGIISDNSEMVSKYNSSSNFESLNSVFVTIDETTINAEIINKFKALHPYPMYSMQYLVSDYYNHVVTNHKITLLFHVIEGIFTNYLSKNEQKEAKQPNKNRLYYKNMVSYFCEGYFEKYDKKYNFEILKVLNKSSLDDFTDAISDTRNCYSHFSMNKQNKITKGSESMIYFELIYYICRMAIISILGLNIDENSVAEFYYSVHDWIVDVCEIKNEEYKSRTYKNDQLMKIIQRKMQGLIE